MSEFRTGHGIARLSRRGRVFAALGVLLAATAGVLWWRAATREPAPTPVAVPPRVCEGSVSAKALAGLLPEYGSPYEEHVEGPDRGYSSTWCMAFGGGAMVQFSYVRETVPNGFEEDLAKRIEGKRNAALTWGPVRGWGSDTSAHLYVACPDKELDLVQQVHIEVSYDQAGERPVENQRALLGQLVADGARYVAKGFKCEGADKLPTGPAVFG